MVKLYLKKLFFTLLFIFAFPIFGAVCAFVWHLIFRYMFPESVSTAANAILGLIFELVLVYLYRCERSPYKRTYIDSFAADHFFFVKDFVSTFKSKDNIVHTLAYLTYDLVQTVRGAISSDSPFFRAVIITVLLVAVRSLLFAVMNTLIWSLVHKKWMRFLKWKNS